MTTTADMITAMGLKVTTVTAAALDRGGEPCEYCSTEDAVVDTQLYYVLDGEPVFEDGCSSCMLARLLESAQLGADTFQVETEAK